MTTPAPIVTFQPRLLGERAAAQYLGISPGTLRALDLPRRCIGRRRLYDRHALDDYADSLPSDADMAPEEENTCDAAWGQG